MEETQEATISTLAAKKKPIKVTDKYLLLQIKRIDARSFKERQKMEGRIRKLNDATRKDLNKAHKRFKADQEKSFRYAINRIEEIVEKSADRIAMARKNSCVASNPKGVMAVINLMAVECLFLLQKRARNVSGAEFVGIRNHLCAIEEATATKMGPSIRAAIYQKEGPEIIDAITEITPAPEIESTEQEEV